MKCDKIYGTARRLTRCSTFAAGLCLLTAIASAQQVVRQPGSQAAVLRGTEFMPDFLPFPGQEQPLWVSADRIFALDGSMRSKEKLPRGLAESLAHTYENSNLSAGRCIQQFSFEEIWTPERTDLKAAVAFAPHVLQATVTGKTPGFQNNLAGTLFRLRIHHVLKGPGFAFQEHYLFIPAGELRLPGLRICKTDPNYPIHLPNVGDRAILLTSWWSPTEMLLSVDGSSGFISIRPNDSVSLPKRYRSTDRNIEGASEKQLMALIASQQGGVR